MSGLLRPKWLPITELFMGFGSPLRYGFTATTTPPEIRVGPEGTLPERWLPVTSMSLAPRSAMPIPEKFLSNCAARHERVLFSTVLAFTSMPLTGPFLNPLASMNMPAQLSWIVFAAIKPPLVLATYMPHAPPEMLLPTTLASLSARSGPKMTMPVSPERLMSLETIVVPVDSTIPVANTVLSVMSLERILVPVESLTSTPAQLPMRSFPAIVVSWLSKASIAGCPSGMLLTTLFTILVLREPSPTRMPLYLSVSGTWFFAIVVLTLLAKAIPLATLPVIRFPSTVALRAKLPSSMNVLLKPRIVKPETLTSLTRWRCPVSLPVLIFTSPKRQIAPGPKAFEQGESALALAGTSITASSSPRSFIPSLRITTSSRWTPRTTIVSPGSAAFTAFWMDSPGPTTELCASAEPMTAPSTTPLATNRVRAMVASNTMVRLIRRPAFLQRTGVSSVVRRHSQRPFISNRRSILPHRGRGITQMSYLWCCLGGACG